MSIKTNQQALEEVTVIVNWNNLPKKKILTRNFDGDSDDGFDQLGLWAASIEWWRCCTAEERRKREERDGLRWYTARDNRNNRTTPCTALVNLDYHGEMEELRGRKWDLTSKMKPWRRRGEDERRSRRVVTAGVRLMASVFDSNLTYFSRKIFRSFEVRNSPQWVGLVSTYKAVLFFPFPHLVKYKPKSY